MNKTNIWKKYNVTRLSNKIGSTKLDWENYDVSSEAKNINLAMVDEPSGDSGEEDFIYGLQSTPDGSKPSRLLDDTKYDAYWSSYIKDGVVASAVDSAFEGLTSGEWKVNAHPETSDENLEKAQEVAKEIEQNLIKESPSKWERFLRNWSRADRIFGFGVWEKVAGNNGKLGSLPWRDPSSLKRAVYTEDRRKLLGFIQRTYESGQDLWIPRNQCIVYSTGDSEIDVDGQSPLRRVIVWVEIKQLITEIEAHAYENHGSGYLFAIPDGENADSGDGKHLMELMNVASGKDTPMFATKPGLDVKWLSPSGKIPNFEKLRRYCDEQISIALSQTGSLIGLGNTGTYNLAEVKDNIENIRRVELYGKQVKNLINEQLIPDMVLARYGEAVEGLMPQLEFTLVGESRDPEKYQEIANLVQAGLIDWTKEDEASLREQMGLAPVEDNEDNIPTNPYSSPEDPQIVKDFPGTKDLTKKQKQVWWKVFEETYKKTQDEGRSASAAFKVANQISMTIGDSSSVKKKVELSQFDIQRIKDWLNNSATSIGKQLHRVSKRHLEEFQDAAKGITSQEELLALSDALREEYMPQYQQAVMPEVKRLVVKGSATVLRELSDANNSSLPKVDKDVSDDIRKLGIDNAEFEDFIGGHSARLARNATNRVDGALVENAINELEESLSERKRNIIPEESALITVAKKHRMRPYNFGRELIINRIVEEARMRSRFGLSNDVDAEYSLELPDAPYVYAEFTSALEDDSCQPCKDNDGNRYIVGSDSYRRDKPPYYRHQGPDDTCLCEMIFELPDEPSYNTTLDDLRNMYFSHEEKTIGSDNYVYEILAFMNEGKI